MDPGIFETGRSRCNEKYPLTPEPNHQREATCCQSTACHQLVVNESTAPEAEPPAVVTTTWK